MACESQESSSIECNTIVLQNFNMPRSHCDDISYKDKSSVSERPSSQEILKCSPNNCHSAFFRYMHLQDHENLHTGIHPYKCKEQNCSKEYFSWADLQKHLIVSHKLDSGKSHYVRDTTDRKCHKCPYEKCNAAFDRKWKLISHMCTHTKEKLYFCSEVGCDKGYTKIGTLRRHVANHHSSRPKIISEYTCPEEGCKKVYKSLGSVKKHYNQKHEKEKLNEYHFTNHKWISSKRTSYKCDECNEYFTRITAWKKHAKTHLTFKCNVLGCSQEFSHFALLKKHKKLNHKESFLCESCNKKFASKRNLQAHCQTHLLPYDRKLFQCPYRECIRVYTRKSNLDQHIRIGHRGIKFQCSFPGCEKRLATKQKLQSHMNLHNPAREPAPQKQTARRQRKDAGKPKRSMAVKLSGLDVPYVEEKRLLCSTINDTINFSSTSVCDDFTSLSSESETTDDGNQSSDTESCSELSEVEELSES